MQRRRQEAHMVMQQKGLVMSESNYLGLQANIICLLLFALGTTAILTQPDWFR
jgi:hypothetical protein